MIKSFFEKSGGAKGSYYKCIKQNKLRLQTSQEGARERTETETERGSEEGD